ncbi:MAG TPA: tRNA (adenosine(37)-N6)-threonylcarbamoyltransferase complex dimerization subunit type 1 TsaB [Pyrinomonadaceae bacterium]
MSNESNFNPLSGAQGGTKNAREGAGEAPRPLILSIDTASAARSLAVTRGAEPLSLHVCGQISANSATVLGDIDRVLCAASVGVQEVELFALAKGPGSFTGLRAGLATLKALAVTLRRPAVGVPTLHAVAHAAASSSHGGSVLALMPAGRGELFAQHSSLGGDGTIREHGPPSHVSPAELIARARGIEGRLTWAGVGAEKFRALIEEAARAEGVEVVEGGAVLPEEKGGRVWAVAPDVGALACVIAALAATRYRPGEDFRGDKLKALYVRPADARIGGA